MRAPHYFAKTSLRIYKNSRTGKLLSKMSSKLLCINFVFLCSTKAYSAETVISPVIKTDPMSSSYIMQLILGLLVVVLCILALAWFAKKMNRFQSVTDGSFKIIGGISMGARERVVLLQVGEEQLLVGVSPGRINMLHALNNPVETTDDSSDGSRGKGFSEKLKTIMDDANKASAKK
jgi:flagellar protein FliO/FliZ